MLNLALRDYHFTVQFTALFRLILLRWKENCMFIQGWNKSEEIVERLDFLKPSRCHMPSFLIFDDQA